MTEYYEEYLRYYDMAARQQELSNLGTVPHAESCDDELMRQVHLYDVVNRKFAGFSQLMNDVFYGWTPDHPYWARMESGDVSMQRMTIAPDWTGKREVFGLPEWLYVFILHRVTGSAINYGMSPSGYHNTVVPSLCRCETIEDMVHVVRHHTLPFYTSIGYQFPAFPKPVPGYKRGGDYFLCEYAPRLSRELAEWLDQGGQRPLREIGEWMFEWNRKNELRAYRFQYAAVIADICDWFPQYVDKTSPFYYGTNAVECISYLAEPVGKRKNEAQLDEVMERIYKDTGAYPYDAEDVCCDFIRWVENYVRPGGSYDGVCRDTVWSSCKIKNHPFGRQKAMLDLGLIPSFNDLKNHPSDDFVLRQAGITADEYKIMVSRA